ncbi:MAG: DUF4288 domain-containing protein, partial [Tahibacter sp.]
MAPRREESPTGWYVGTYQLRFIELDDPRNEDENRRFLIWENTVLIKADRFVEAYRKVVKIGKSATAPYKGGPDGIDVRWVFEGVIDVLPVY